MLFKKFHAQWGEGTRYADGPDSLEISESLRQLLRDEWSTYGLAAYCRNQLWTVDPREYADALRLWLPEWSSGPEKAEVFARTAFGDLLVVRWVGGVEAVGCLSVHYGRYSELGESLRLVMNLVLADEKFIRDVLAGDLGQEAERKLGAVSQDEMFAFVPALALGGTDTLEHIQKVKLLPQLELLSQLHDKLDYQS